MTWIINGIWTWCRSQFVKLIKMTVMVTALNIVILQLKTPIQIAIYHIILAPHILFGYFISYDTISTLTRLVGMFLVYLLFRFIIKSLH